MPSDGVLKVSEMPLPPEGVATTGISYDADNLFRTVDEFVHRHGRVQLGRLMHELGIRHGMFICLSSRGEQPANPDGAL